MRLIADLHVHSKFSRAVSQSMTLPTMAAFARKKGVHLVGTGDFTHPAWVESMGKELDETADGFAVLKGTAEPRFTYTSEIACIYSKGGQTRRIHLVVVAPRLEIIKAISAQLALIGNLKADGRPILGVDAKEIVKICRAASPDCLVIPAHVWTPWFSVFGSMSGFDSLEQCFEEETEHIHAVETGLSSDPPMNWRLAQLDGVRITSFSDAHSAQKMGREATVFELERPTYEHFRQALTKPTANSHIASTIEFFPEEGKYHWDGHRSCNIRWSPEETAKHRGVCPVCKRPVTIGVMNRVAQIADRPEGYQPPDRPPFSSLIQLDKIIADALGVGAGSKRVQQEYDALLTALGSEFTILLATPLEALRQATLPRIAEGIVRVREKKVQINPGFDGVYGTISIFGGREANAGSGQAKLL